MKSCCDAEAAGLNGGRFKSSHIRLAASELIRAVTSTPVCTHTHHKKQQLSLPDHPPRHLSAFPGFTCCKRKQVNGSRFVGRTRTSPSCPDGGTGPAASVAAWIWQREDPARSTEPGLSSKHPQVTNCDSIYYKPHICLFYPSPTKEGRLAAGVGCSRSQHCPGVCCRSL